MALVKKITKKQKEQKLQSLKTETPIPVDAYPMLLHKLREASLQVRGGDNWVRGLSDKNILALYDLIIQGTQEEIILENARTVWSAPVDILCNADRASLRLFRSKVIGSTVHSLQAVTPEEKKFRKQFVDRARSLLKTFDPIAEMIDIVQEQKRRVQIGMDAEIVSGALSSQTSVEIGSYNRMLHDLVTKLQSIGLIEEKPVEQVINMNTTFTSVVDLVATTGENKMLSIASKFMSQIDDCIVEMEVSKDGSFSLIGKNNPEIILDKE